MSKVIDLDILRPEPSFVKLNGKSIDVSFVPTAITFDLDGVVQELMKLDSKTIESNQDESKKALGLAVRLCSIFSAHQYPEMDEAFFWNHVSPTQVKGFADAIQQALFKTYSEIGEHAKN